MDNRPLPHRTHSADATAITYESTGSGPPIVIVPGAISDAHTWRAVCERMGSALRAIAINRRGRGMSGGEPPWRPEDERADVRAVLADVGPRPILMGHSSGGVLALQLALSGYPLSGLVLYEPAVFGPDDTPDPGFAEGVRTLIDRGEHEAALERFVSGVKSGSAAEVSERRGMTEEWRRTVQQAWTIPFDMEVQASYRFDPGEVSAIEVPALMIIGEISPRPTREGSEAIAAALPDCAVLRLAGQGHEAARRAPESLADAVLAFCAERCPR